MKRFFLLFTMLAVFQLINAQLSEGGMPPSTYFTNLKSAVQINSSTLPQLNINKLRTEDEKAPIPLRYSIYTDVNADIKNQGTLIYNGDKGRIWQYEVKSENALSLSLFFTEYILPEGAELFVYNYGKSIVYGAYTSKNNKSFDMLRIGDFPGNNLIIEYYEPKGADFEGIIVLGSVGQAYRDIFGVFSEQATPDNIDINCPAGDPYQLEKHAVARMSFVENKQGKLCSGALINNVRSDGTPYFLTANHCISTNESAMSLVTYFNYEDKDCNDSPASLVGISISGSTKKSTNAPSDFTLLQLSTNPDPDFKPYFAGWNALSDSVIQSGFTIHHPSGKVKKIALSYQPIYSLPYELSWGNGTTTTKTPPDTHWWVRFDLGFTAGGSSGSPLFDNHHLIVGQLHGGADADNFYGKLSYSWDKGSFSSQRLNYYLDPDKTGVKAMNGYNPPDNDPEASFYSNFLHVGAGAPLTIKNNSLFGPVKWKWSFDPSTVTYYEGTTDTSRQPVVSFDSLGYYSITLRASDSDTTRTSTRTKSNYIFADTTISVSVYSPFDSLMSFNSFKDFFIKGHGAAEYKWQFTGDTSFLQIKRFSPLFDTVFLTVNPGILKDSSFSFTAKLTGTQGKYSDVDSLKFQVLYPFMDNIENAFPLQMGNNGPFTNDGATVQTGEPNPPSGSCNTQDSWCSCNISDTILDNSVWFTFTGPETGYIQVDVPGFDDQVALYDANSYQDILSGDTSKFKIVAANDDYFDSTKFYAARIERAKVTPGKKYWVQVDGSACGTWGFFHINLNLQYPDAIEKINFGNKYFNLYPNPATNELNIRSSLNMTHVQAQVISLDGKIRKTIQFNTLQAGEVYELDLGSLESGFYILKILSKNGNYNMKFAIK